MIGKVILSGIAAGMTIYFMAQTDNPTLQVGGAVASASTFGFTTTRLLLDEQRERKARAAEARAYVLMRRMNQERLRRYPPMPVACRGCRHYHGRTYHGNFLVCGMHPYGVETETCGDWEARSNGSAVE